MATDQDLLIKVGLGGAKEMLAEMAAIRDQSQALLKGMTEEAAKATGAFGKLRQEFPALDSAVKLATNPLVLMTAAVGGVVAAFGTGVKAASEFNNEFLQLQNLNLDKSADDIAGLKDTILGLSLESGRSAKEVSKAFFDIQSGTGLFGEDVAGITDRLADFATATNTDFNTAVGGAIKAIRAFNLDVEDMDAFLASSFATVQVGITTFDELAAVQTEYAGAAAASGQSVNDANKLFAAFTATAKDSAQAANLTKTAFQDLTKKNTVEGFKSIGVSVFDVSGKMRSVDAVVRDLVPKLKDMSAEDFAVLKENIGGSEGIRGLLDQAKSQGDALIETFKAFDGATENFDIEKLLENAKGDFTTLKNIVGNQVNTVMIQLGEAILPVLARALNTISQLIPKITSFFRDNAEILKVVGTAIASVVGAFAAYKSVIFVVASATSAFAKAKENYGKATKFLSTEVDVARVKLTNLYKTLALNPWGALAVGVGLVIAAFIAFNDTQEVLSNTTKRINELTDEVKTFTSEATKTLSELDKVLKDVRSGKDTGETFITRIQEQLVEAEKAALSAGEALALAQSRAAGADESFKPVINAFTGEEQAVVGSFAFELQNFKDAELRVAQLREQLRQAQLDVQNAAKAADLEVARAAGLTVRSLAFLGEQTKKITDELQKVAIGSDAFNRLAIAAKKAADELRTAQEELTLIQNAGGSVDEISNRLNIMQSRLNKAEFGPEFVKIAEELKKLSAELETARTRMEAFTESGGKLAEVAKKTEEAPGPTQENPLSQSLSEFLEGLELTKVSEFQKGIANLRDELIDTGKAMRDLGIRAFGDLATGIGKAIAQGSKISDVFKEIGRTLAIEAPKLLGTALLNAATTAQPWPLALGLAAAGAALLGLSGFAAGKFEQADQLNGNSGVGPTGNAVSDQVTQDLGTFSDQDLGMGPTINIFMDGKEIAGIVKNRIDILNELQIGG